MLAAVVLAGMIGGRAPRALADSRPSVTIGDTAVVEGDSGTTSARFAVRLSAPSPNKVTVHYATSTPFQGANSPEDYRAAGGNVVFAPGTTLKSVAITVKGDDRAEADEQFVVTLSNPVEAVLLDPDAVGTIVDDDALPYVAIGNTRVTEGDSGTVDAVFPVTLSAANPDPVRVRWFTNAIDSAQQGVDYKEAHGTVAFAPGQTAASVTVKVYGDLDDEGLESFFVTLRAPDGARLAPDPIGYGDIVDDDTRVLATVVDAAIAEGNPPGDPHPLSFEIRFDRPSKQTEVIAYSTIEATATPGSDYVAKKGTVTFAPGETSKQVGIGVVPDFAEENAPEYFFLDIASLTAAFVTDGRAAGYIINDDDDHIDPDPPTGTGTSNMVTGMAASVVEGDTDTVLRFPLRASGGGGGTVQYDVFSDGADPSSDFVPRSGTVNVGLAGTTINVTIKGDDVIEDDERIALTLRNVPGNPNPVIIAEGSWIYGIIHDDDLPPVLTVSDTTVTEGDTGTADAAFELTLSEPNPIPVKATFTTSDWSATAPGDYTAKSKTVTIEPGETSRTVHVSVNGDTVDENDEVIRARITAPVNAVIEGEYAYGVIVDDDHDPWVSVGDVSVAEGDAGNSAMAFPVTLTGPSAHTVSVDYFTNSTGPAVAGVDYVATSGTLAFAPGEVTKNVNVPIVGDVVDEGEETLHLTLTNPVTAFIVDGDALGRIVDDDTVSRLSVDDAAVEEGDTGTASLVFHATLAPASPEPVTVTYATSDNDALAGSDYTAVSGSLTFTPGQTNKNITVKATGDVVDENNENFTLSVSGAPNVSLLDGTGTGTIFDDDLLSTLSVLDADVVEGNAATASAKFVVQLAPAAKAPVTVDYHTADGSAVAGSDYTAANGTLTFTAGQTSKTVTVPVTGDSADEGSGEDFFLVLANPTNATASRAAGRSIVVDDDPAPSLGNFLSLGDTAVAEGANGTTNAVFTVTLLPAATGAVTVNYATSDNTASAAASDYTPQFGTLSFNAGQTTKTISVPVVGDGFVEGNERFGLTLSNALGATIDDATGNATILDDDHFPRLTSISNPVVFESNSGTTTAAFTFTLSAPSAIAAWVDWATFENNGPGNARAGEDYDDAEGTVTFMPGETTKTVSIAVRGDTVDEGDEVFYMVVGDRGALTIFDPLFGTATIRDDDTSVLSGAVTASGGAGQGGVTITRTGGTFPSAAVTTAADGSFSLGGVPNGRYVLTPTKAGRTFTPAARTVDVRSGPVTGLTFTIGTP